MEKFKKMAKKVCPPKGSWVDKSGKRWMKVFFDVMSGFGGVASSFDR